MLYKVPAFCPSVFTLDPGRYFSTNVRTFSGGLTVTPVASVAAEPLELGWALSQS